MEPMHMWVGGLLVHLLNKACIVVPWNDDDTTAQEDRSRCRVDCFDSRSLKVDLLI